MGQSNTIFKSLVALLNDSSSKFSNRRLAKEIRSALFGDKHRVEMLLTVVVARRRENHSVIDYRANIQGKVLHDEFDLFAI